MSNVLQTEPKDNDSISTRLWNSTTYKSSFFPLHFLTKVVIILIKIKIQYFTLVYPLRIPLPSSLDFMWLKAHLHNRGFK